MTLEPPTGTESGMGPRIVQLLLLGIVMVLFMDEGDRVLTTKWIRFCNKCDLYNGTHCVNRMKSCWKFNAMRENRSCRTDHFYFAHRFSEVYLFRYTKLSCEPCEEGMFQVFHDLLRETFCCTDNDRCNDPEDHTYVVKEYVSPDSNRIS